MRTIFLSDGWADFINLTMRAGPNSTGTASLSTMANASRVRVSSIHTWMDTDGSGHDWALLRGALDFQHVALADFSVQLWSRTSALMRLGPAAVPKHKRLGTYATS